jgi:eukaryotic-like serine/threonine-protein kinase
VRRAWLWLRGLHWTRRDPGAITQLELTRVDVCESVAMGLLNADLFRSADFCVRFVLSALRLGEPSRVVRAMGLEADLLAMQGKTRRATQLAAKLEAVVAQHPTPAATSVLYCTQGIIDMCCHNQWRGALERLSEALSLYLAHESSIDFETNSVDMFCCIALNMLGDWPELARRLPALTEAAMRRGDRYASVIFRVVFAPPWMMRDDAVTGEAEVMAAIEEWGGRDSYGMQHLYALLTRCELLLYRGEAEAAQDLITADAAPLRRSLLMLSSTYRLLFEQMRGRVLAAVAASGSPARRRLAQGGGKRTARWLGRDPHPAGRALATLLDAGVARGRGDLERCRAGLDRAERELERLEMSIWAAATRRRRGQLVGGDEGDALIARADAEMAARGVLRPDRIAATLVPGWAE